MINKYHTRYCSVCYRSSRPEVFFKKGVPRYFAKFPGKDLYQGLFFNKVAGLKPVYVVVFALLSSTVEVGRR